MVFFLLRNFVQLTGPRATGNLADMEVATNAGQIPHSNIFCMIIRVNGCICNKAGDEYT